MKITILLEKNIIANVNFMLTWGGGKKNLII